MKHSLVTKTLASLCTLALSAMLLFSFGLHAVELEHTHPGEHSHAETSDGAALLVFGEYLHGTEKKLFFYAVLGLLLLGALICVPRLQAIEMFTHLERYRYLYIKQLSAWLYRSYDHHCLSLSSGILNPRLH